MYIYVYLYICIYIYIIYLYIRTYTQMCVFMSTRTYSRNICFQSTQATAASQVALDKTRRHFFFFDLKRRKFVFCMFRKQKPFGGKKR